jgi:hypothetical protein
MRRRAALLGSTANSEAGASSEAIGCHGALWHSSRASACCPWALCPSLAPEEGGEKLGHKLPNRRAFPSNFYCRWACSSVCECGLLHRAADVSLCANVCRGRQQPDRGCRCIQAVEHREHVRPPAPELVIQRGRTASSMSSAAEASPAGSGQLAGKEVLVIGGTQFMGRHVVSSLLSHGAHVTILNRGKTPNPFKGDACVTHLRCDRLNEGKRFRALLAAGPGPVAGHTQCGAGKEGGGMTGAWSGWDAVIDFVCFRKKGMEDILSQAHAIGHYVFISSDSGKLHSTALREFLRPLCLIPEK